MHIRRKRMLTKVPYGSGREGDDPLKLRHHMVWVKLLQDHSDWPLARRLRIGADRWPRGSIRDFKDGRRHTKGNVRRGREGGETPARVHTLSSQCLLAPRFASDKLQYPIPHPSLRHRLPEGILGSRIASRSGLASRSLNIEEARLPGSAGEGLLHHGKWEKAGGASKVYQSKSSLKMVEWLGARRWLLPVRSVFDPRTDLLCLRSELLSG